MRYYSTYRKPMCTYDYLPFVSCHSNNTKLGIFKGEVLRLVRTNMFQDSPEKDVGFTFNKLVDRGHDRDALRKIRRNMPWIQKAARVKHAGSSSTGKALPLQN